MSELPLTHHPPHHLFVAPLQAGVTSPIVPFHHPPVPVPAVVSAEAHHHPQYITDVQEMEFDIPAQPFPPVDLFGVLHHTHHIPHHHPTPVSEESPHQLYP